MAIANQSPKTTVGLSDVRAAKLLAQANRTAAGIEKHSPLNWIGTHENVQMAIDQYQSAANAADSVEMVDEIGSSEMQAAQNLLSLGNNPLHGHILAAESLVRAGANVFTTALKKPKNPTGDESTTEMGDSIQQYNHGWSGVTHGDLNKVANALTNGTPPPHLVQRTFWNPLTWFS